MFLVLSKSIADSDSFSSVRRRSFRSLQVTLMILSSAKLCKSDFVSHKNKSFIKTLNRNEPSIEHCGTPKSIARYIVNFHTLFSIF